jgi:nicotinate-nucleotide pyrophosphorylase (carboxylating)
MTTNRALTDLSVLRLVQIAIAEDIGRGDLTSESLVNDTVDLAATINAKAPGVVAGTIVAGLAFSEVDAAIDVEWNIHDGARVAHGEQIGRVRGPARGILTAERTALNFLQRMSGVATITRRYVDAVAGTGAQILDTRKTLPGWRLLDKYAVTAGGGVNHRMGLYDMVMIKDNHVDAFGSIAGAVAAARGWLVERGMDEVKLEVEARNLDEVSQAVSCEGVSRIMFDNFPLELMREAVTLVDGRVETEASGNVSLETVRRIAETGVGLISVGSLTHSAPALDISLTVRK